MIEVGKTYKNTQGDDVKVIYKCKDNCVYPFVCIRMFSDGSESSYTVNEDGISNFYPDIVIPTDWSKVAVDTPVICTDVGGYIHRRYFAKVGIHGEPRAWNEGTTSWTSEHSSTSSWAEMRIATKEDIES
ncbi:MAG TPA: hypothetical protein VFM18_13495 [Methanosarcina sp.]|nr:hypothetical protein [Methanosarcina sp.]